MDDSRDRDDPPRDRLRALLDDDAGPVLRRPPALRDGRYAVGGRAVRGVLLVVVVALVVLGARYVMAQREAAPVAEPTADGPTVVEGGDRSAFATAEAPVTPATTAPASAGGGTGATPAAQVTVHVVGQVRSPGLISLPGGSRVGDAVEQAGGVTRSADVGALNLARVLVDGEQVVVPKPGQTPQGAAAATGAPGVAGAPASPGATPGATPGGGAAAPSAGALVNLNTADLTTLETLPGVGPVLGQAIVEWREQHGGFTSVDELDDVSGIGEKTYAELAPRVTV